jgi:hypothetical protein
MWISTVYSALHIQKPSSFAVAQNWAIVAPMLAELESSAAAKALPVVVDIGAGTQDMDRRWASPLLATWLAERSDRVCAVVGDLDEVFGPSVAHQGNRAQFDYFEDAPERQRLYGVAGTTVHVGGLGLENATHRIADTIRRVVLAHET